MFNSFFSVRESLHAQEGERELSMGEYVMHMCL